MAKTDIDIMIDNMSGKQFAEHVIRYLREVKGLSQKDAGIVKPSEEKSKHLETAVLNLFGQSIDFVQARSEIYSDSRIPTTKESTAQEDALRRDFNLNTLFFNINENRLEDFTGKGIQDLKEGILRTPLSAKQTFIDDPLRVLRAIRFAAQFGFSLDPEIVKAVQDPEVKEAFKNKLSRERIEIELRKALSGPNPVLAAKLIKELGLREDIFKMPESLEKWDMDQQSVHHCYNVWDHTYHALSNLQDIIKTRSTEDVDKFVLNFSLLLHDVGKLDPTIHGVKEVEGKINKTYYGHEEKSAEIAEYILKNLPGIRTEEIERIKNLIVGASKVNPQRQAESEICNLTRKALGKFIRQMGDDWENAIDLAEADWSAHKENWYNSGFKDTYYKTMKEQIRNLSAEGPKQIQIMRPLLDGNELMALFNRKGGKWLGKLNSILIDYQLENPDVTKEQVAEYAQKMYKELELEKMSSNFISKRATDERVQEQNKLLLEKQLQHDKDSPHTDMRPQFAKEYAQKLYDSGVKHYVHTGSFNDLSGIGSVVGEICVTSWDETKKLFTHGPVTMGALFEGRASHMFKTDAFSSVNSIGLRELTGSTEEQLMTIDPKHPQDEGWFNPSAAGNKLVGFVVLGDQDNPLYLTYSQQAKKLADLNGVSFITMHGDPTKMEDVRKQQNFPIIKDLPLEEEPTIERYKNIPEMKEYASLKLSKRAGELVQLYGFPQEIKNDLRNLPGIDDYYFDIFDKNPVQGTIQIAESAQKRLYIKWLYAHNIVAGKQKYTTYVNVVLEDLNGFKEGKSILSYSGFNAKDVLNTLKTLLEHPNLKSNAYKQFFAEVIPFKKAMPRYETIFPKTCVCGKIYETLEEFLSLPIPNSMQEHMGTQCLSGKEPWKSWGVNKDVIWRNCSCNSTLVVYVDCVHNLEMHTDDKRLHILFVYGTLRKGQANHGRLKKSKYLGQVETAAKYELIVFDDSPGLIEPGTNSVVGELYEVNSEVLKEIDGFEQPFERRPIELENGKMVYAYFMPKTKTHWTEKMPYENKKM